MATPVPLPGFVVPPPRLEIIDLDDQRLVQLSGHAVASYRREDRGTERVIATQLAEVLPLPDIDIARAFGIHPVSLSRFRGQLRAGGAQALMPRKTGPRGPTKLTAQMEARFRKLRAEGLSLRAIAERVSRPGRTISYGTVAAVLKRAEAEPQPQPLPLEPEPEPESEEPQPSPRLPLRPGELRASRYAGALMLFAGLARLDVWRIFRSLGASCGPARRWGWAETVAAIVFCFALRFRSVEDSKNALRDDLGVLLGQPRSPGLLTLRLKIAALAESVDPAALSREFFRRYLALEPVWEGLYYLDGHFCPYYGEHPTPKGWDSKRRLAVKGHTDVYAHDARGRVLFFLSQPLNDSLGRAIPFMVEEIRRVHGEAPFTLVFDRGGYSGHAFRFLKEQGVGFITYLMGRKARRRHPQRQFRRGWFSFEGQRHNYRLYEKPTRFTGAGPLRTILFLGDENQQVPVLTNLEASWRPARVVHCLGLRWRQENSFKYLSEHYGIEQLIQYGADKEEQARLVPNPRRRALKERVRAVSQEIQALEAQLGRALDHNDETQRPTARGLKIAHGHLRQQLAQRREVLARLETRLRHTPGQIAAAEVDKTRFLLREDRRLVVNTLKLVAYNAERLLTLRFNEHFERRKDAFAVFRSLLHLPGQIRTLDADHLEIRLKRPDSAKVADALQALMTQINQEGSRMLGDGPVLSFVLRD